MESAVRNRPPMDRADSRQRRDRNVLRLGHALWTLRPTLHNGPGWRVPLWVQGCSIRCTTVCLNPRFLEHGGGFEYHVDAVVSSLAQLLDRMPGRVEGITMLGGEPTDQAASVALLFESVRALGLSTMLYSGATIEQLRARQDSGIDRLLNLTDLLLDGPFLPWEFDDSLVWRGSRNQRILRLSGRYTENDIERAITEQGRAYSMLLLPDGRVSVSGLQTRKGAGLIERHVRRG
jgi:anaerobic ribonucleoside-triphosphate reductase activating protein